MMTLPVVIIFFAQKHFIQGVTLTGMRGNASVVAMEVPRLIGAPCNGPPLEFTPKSGD